MNDPYLLVVVCCHKGEGFDFVLLKHFFKHYFACGVKPENIFITLLTDGSAPEVAPHLRAIGVNLVKELESLGYDPARYTRERQALQGCIPPDAWFINPEVEEFISFPRPVTAMVSDMEAAGYNALTGWLWDRFDQKFLLKEVHPEHPIHLQFPVALEYMEKVLLVNTRKEVLARNCFRIQPGAHCLDANGHSIHSAPRSWHPRVEHYKWTAGLRARMERLCHISEAYPEMPAPGKYQTVLKAIQNSPEGDVLTNKVSVRTTIQFPQTAVEKLRFVHIPKTAGTTVIEVLNHWFPGIHRINSWNSLSESERANLKEEPIICGHIPLRYHAIDYERSAKWFTILRDPVQQAISCYYEAAKNIAHRTPALQDLLEEGLEALILSGRFAEIWTDSTRYLSSLPKEANIEQALQSAKCNLHHFTLIGFYEDLGVFLQKAAQILHKEPLKNVPWENKNSYKPAQVTLSSQARAALTHLVRHDQELYNYAREIFR